MCTGSVKSLMACVLAGSLLLVTVVPAFAEEPGGATPEALVERMKRAAEAEDLGEMMACVAPAGRADMAQMMYLMSTMVVGFAMMGAEMGGSMAEGLAEGMAETMDEELTAEQKAEMAAAKEEALAAVRVTVDAYNAMVARYGLPILEEGEEPDDADLDAIFRDIDHAAFVEDVIAFMGSLPGEDAAESAAPPSPFGDVVMTELNIEGDSATAVIDGKNVKFILIDGRWYIDEEIFGGPGGS